MASNHKLTAILKGRRIVSTSNRSDTFVVGFDDGSLMTVRTAGSSNSASTGSAIAAVRQQDTTLTLEFDNGQTLEIPTAEPTACVMVRDPAGAMEYAD